MATSVSTLEGREAGSSRTPVTKVAVWVGVSAVFMLIGAFGPWAKAFGVLSVSGTDGDGVIVVIAALVIGGMVILRLYKTRRLWVMVVAILAALIATATSIYYMANIQNAISNSELQGIVSVGWGLWIDCIASASAVIALVLLARARDINTLRQSKEALPQ